MSESKRAMSFSQQMYYSVGNFGVGLLPSIIGSWAMYYYAPPANEGSCLTPYVAIGLIGLMLAIGRIAEALLNPFIGDWSDKTNSRYGRRIPFIVVGTPIMVISMIMVWFPPIAHESLLNAAWVCFWMVLMSCSFAVVVAPYLSLLPELTPHNDERITVSSYMALFEVLGVLTAAAAAGTLIDAYKCGTPILGMFELNGFQIAGILFGLATFVAFMLTGLKTKEGDYSEAKQVNLPIAEGAKEVMKNTAFRPYLWLVTAFRLGIDMVIVVIPYVVTTTMGGDEGDAVGIQLVVMVGAAMQFPLVNWLSVKYGKKAVTISGGLGFAFVLPLIFSMGKIPGLDPMVQGYIIFALATFPVAVFNVTIRPLLADVIDYDEQNTGLRREAMYNGMEGLFTRSASGLAWVMCSLLFMMFGNSAQDPLGVMLVGPVGGAFVLIGTLLFFKYPFKK